MITVSKDAARPTATLLHSKDIHLIFANLEAIAGLAEAFWGVLDSAKGDEDGDGLDDRIGEVFAEMVSSERAPTPSATGTDPSLCSSRGYRTCTRPTALSIIALSCDYRSFNPSSRATSPTARLSVTAERAPGTLRVSSSSLSSAASSRLSSAIAV